MLTNMCNTSYNISNYKQSFIPKEMLNLIHISTDLIIYNSFLYNRLI